MYDHYNIEVVTKGDNYVFNMFYNITQCYYETTPDNKS